MPTIDPAEADVKVPAWLNDPTIYHNRGDSTWEGESVTFGDFSGLDDLMTEDPKVVDGFVDVYNDWVDLGIDGFRIDTAKHVNFEFWQKWSTAVPAHAASIGNDDFFMFGEVYDADPTKLSPYVRNSDMNSVLDFTFQSQAVGYASGNSAKSLQSLFAGDDYYTTPHSSATALPTFLGNHDMGRVGYFLQNTDSAVQRDSLAHDLMFLTRGQPVVYYGDEQGFAGAGQGNDQSARQTLFPSQVTEYTGQNLITGEPVGTGEHFATDGELYTHIAELSALRQAHPALSSGAQIERYVDNGPGVYAFSRVDASEKTEYLVAVNNSAAEKTVSVPTLTKSGAFTPLYGATRRADVGCRRARIRHGPRPRRRGLEGRIARSARRRPRRHHRRGPDRRCRTLGRERRLGRRRRRHVAADQLRLAHRRRHGVDRARHGRDHRAARLPRREGPRGGNPRRVQGGDDGCRRQPRRGEHLRLRRQRGHDRGDRGARGGDLPRDHPGQPQQRDGLRRRLDPGLRDRQAHASAPTASTPAPSTSPQGDYEFKVALNGSWDVNYGAERCEGRRQHRLHGTRRTDHLLLRPAHPPGAEHGAGPHGHGARAATRARSAARATGSRSASPPG